MQKAKLRSKSIQGDVLTVHTGYIGTSCVVPEKYDKCLTFTTLITTTDSAVLIGEYLAQYLNSDVGMRAVQRKSEKLQNIKKSMLEKMFV